MRRDPDKILAFKRLTQLGNLHDIVFTDKVRNRILLIKRKIAAQKFEGFAKPYAYVALATCLEAAVKYKLRAIMEIVGSDADVFKHLYGESKLDLDLLFHVVNESITLSDLVSEVT